MLHETSEIGHYSGNRRNIDAEYSQVEEVQNPNEAQEWMEKAKSKETQARFEEKYKDQINKLKTGGKPKVISYYCGSSHIDISWCWRYLQTIEKARVTFTKACFHIENVPEFSFTGSQSQLYEWVKARYPELFERMIQAATSGRFELAGGSWVEYDGHIPSGESIVRQRLLGQLFLKKHFGQYATIEWLPDSFGYATQLPQILKKSNARAFYTNKLGANMVNKFPFCTFLWEAPDGTRILAESLNAASRKLLKPCIQEKMHPFTYESDDFENPDFFSTDIIPYNIIPYGKGDGGHGPTGEEVQERLFMHKKGIITLAPAKTYFDKIEKECLDRLPVWKDELYLEWHRGTLTSHALVKLMNRYNEWILPALEKLCVLACLNTNFEYPREILQESWKITLLNQFHDVLPGSCIPETYDDCWNMWKWQTETHGHVIDEIFAAMVRSLATAHEETKPDSPGIKARILHFNPLDHTVKTTVEMPATILGDEPASQVISDDGTRHAVCRVPGVECPGEPLYAIPERIAFVMDLKPHRVTVLSFVDEKITDEKKNVHYHADEKGIELENQALKIIIDKATAAITSMKFHDGKEWKESLLQGKKRFDEGFDEMEPGLKLYSFSDFPKDFAAWNINPKFRHHPYDTRVISVRIADAGDNHITAETVVEYPTKNPEKIDLMDISLVTTRYTLYHDDPMLYLTMMILFNGKRITMKLDIPTCTHGKEIEAEVAYSTDRRSTVPKTARNKERWENVMHTWANIQVPDNSWGFAVINNGKYGIDYREGYLGISIVRGQDYPNAHYEAWVYNERFDRLDEGMGYQPSWIDQGNHVVKLALYPHNGTATDAKVLEHAHAFNVDPLVCKIPNTVNQASIARHGGFKLPISVPPVCITAIKRAEDDSEMNELVRSGYHFAGVGKIEQIIIIRAVNTRDTDARSVIHLSGLRVTDVLECDLIERKIGNDCELASDGGAITEIKANWKPFEIKTFGLLL
nr:glycoside hydrolase family 38 C-terminal domain-containing protein [Candidatus Sigynarchaeota archaeon]